MVHEFVNSDGLNALITVGTDADQNYQNYILRGGFVMESDEKETLLICLLPQEADFPTVSYFIFSHWSSDALC